MHLALWRGNRRLDPSPLPNPQTRFKLCPCKETLDFWSFCLYLPSDRITGIIILQCDYISHSVYRVLGWDPGLPAGQASTLLTEDFKASCPQPPSLLSSLPCCLVTGSQQPDLHQSTFQWANTSPAFYTVPANDLDPWPGQSLLRGDATEPLNCRVTHAAVTYHLYRGQDRICPQAPSKSFSCFSMTSSSSVLFPFSV